MSDHEYNDMTAEERRGAEWALRDAAAAAEQAFQLPREFGFEVSRFLHRRADRWGDREISAGGELPYPVISLDNTTGQE